MSVDLAPFKGNSAAQFIVRKNSQCHVRVDGSNGFPKPFRALMLIDIPLGFWPGVFVCCDIITHAAQTLRQASSLVSVAKKRIYFCNVAEINSPS